MALCGLNNLGRKRGTAAVFQKTPSQFSPLYVCTSLLCLLTNDNTKVSSLMVKMDYQVDQSRPWIQEIRTNQRAAYGQ